MPLILHHLRIRKVAIVASILLVFLAGCGSGLTTHPVSGTVTLDGEGIKPKSGMVVLRPNAEKGNTSEYQPAGSIDESGNYVIYTKDKYGTNHRGAPPGWYTVTVNAQGSPPASKGPRFSRPIPKPLLPLKYGSEKTTKLEFEVVANPPSGAYDLKLKKD